MAAASPVGRAQALVAGLVGAGQQRPPRHSQYSPEVPRRGGARAVRERGSEVPSLEALLPREQESLLALLASADASVTAEPLAGGEFLVTVSLVVQSTSRQEELVKYQFRAPTYIAPKTSAAVERYRSVQEEKARRTGIPEGGYASHAQSRRSTALDHGDAEQAEGKHIDGDGGTRALSRNAGGTRVASKSLPALLKEIREIIAGVCHLRTASGYSMNQRAGLMTSSSSNKATDPSRFLYLNELIANKTMKAYVPESFTSSVHEIFVMKYGMQSIAVKEEERFVTSVAAHREVHPEVSLFAYLLKPPMYVTNADVDAVRRMYSIIQLHGELMDYEKSYEGNQGYSLHGQRSISYMDSFRSGSISTPRRTHVYNKTYSINSKDAVLLLLKFAICLDISDGLNVSAILFLILRELTSFSVDTPTKPIPSLYQDNTDFFTKNTFKATQRGLIKSKRIGQSIMPSIDLSNIAYAWLLNVPVSSMPYDWVYMLYSDEISNNVFDPEQIGSRSASEYAQILMQQGGSISGAELCELTLLSISTGRILCRKLNGSREASGGGEFSNQNDAVEGYTDGIAPNLDGNTANAGEHTKNSLNNSVQEVQGHVSVSPDNRNDIDNNSSIVTNHNNSIINKAIGASVSLERQSNESERIDLHSEVPRSGQKMQVKPSQVNKISFDQNSVKEYEHLSISKPLDVSKTYDVHENSNSFQQAIAELTDHELSINSKKKASKARPSRSEESREYTSIAGSAEALDPQPRGVRFLDEDESIPKQSIQRDEMTIQQASEQSGVQIGPKSAFWQKQNSQDVSSHNGYNMSSSITNEDTGYSTYNADTESDPYNLSREKFYQEQIRHQKEQSERGPLILNTFSSASINSSNTQSARSRMQGERNDNYISVTNARNNIERQEQRETNLDFLAGEDLNNFLDGIDDLISGTNRNESESNSVDDHAQYQQQRPGVAPPPERASTNKTSTLLYSPQPEYEGEYPHMDQHNGFRQEISLDNVPRRYAVQQHIAAFRGQAGSNDWAGSISGGDVHTVFEAPL